ncbi:MAG: hypothetical protein GIS02_03895 [Methanosarcinales archaeon]|uniref:Uncharacterized protein n=1 Tax=Candidatus Ethanoperedens thermophilum TaxID=2766897 RepID=A0A848D9C2_9EURY|nr:hypothetical protein [Candidatus Ethanoperedens thermophilum]
MKSHTMDEYKEIGMDFKILNDFMVHLIVKVGKYGKLKYGDKMSKELDKINQIQSDLEEEMFKEYPKDANTEIFYGKRPDITNLLKEYYEIPNR